MDALNLLGYLLIFLLVAISNAFVYSRMRDWRFVRIKELNQEIAQVEEDYKNLTHEVREAQSRENKLKAELLEMKKTALREDSIKENDNSSPEEKAKTTLDVLREMKVLDDEKMAKASNYLERSDNAGLKVEDVLVLLGLITADQLKKAQKKSGGGN
ncbi:MAG: hypothetical protein D5R98_07520 [Desulfonatronovibrio sp. MSAO_Bac4]|nr:MAG: hypothetical protein D5R98_07520 [Desulfonatronovibrio sp. MSAO_Bac4]